MNKSEILSQIAEGFAVCENEKLNQVRANNVRTLFREYSKEDCMPKATDLYGNLIALNNNEYTPLISHNGIYQGLVFVLDGTAYKYTSFDGEEHRQVLENMGFSHVSPVDLRLRKKIVDRKQPLKIEGAIAFSPQESTTKLPAYTFCKVFRPTGAVEGLVFRGSQRYYYYPSSQRLVLDAVVRELLDHGYDPYEENKWDNKQRCGLCFFRIKKTLRLSKALIFTFFWRWPDLHWRLKDIIRNVYHYSLSFGG